MNERIKQVRKGSEGEEETHRQTEAKRDRER